MKLNPRRLVFGLSLAIALPMSVLPVVASAQPQLTIQSEQAAHPRITDAVRKLQQALQELHAAPDDFGGNKYQAEKDLQAAIHSLKKCLWFRLKMDDAAIDKAQVQ
jgi:hypothetical protein